MDTQKLQTKLFNSGRIPKVVFRNDSILFYQSRAGSSTTKKNNL